MEIDLLDDNVLGIVIPDGPFAGQGLADIFDLNTLLRNLAIAGALCASWEAGQAACPCDCDDWVHVSETHIALRGSWFPGCGIDATDPDHLATTSINGARGQAIETAWPASVDTRIDTTVDAWPTGKRE